MQRTFNPGEGVGPKVNLSSGCPLPVQASSFIKSEDRTGRCMTTGERRCFDERNARIE